MLISNFLMVAKGTPANLCTSVLKIWFKYTGWVLCSGTANRGCCEANKEAMVIFLLSMKIQCFSMRKKSFLLNFSTLDLQQNLKHNLTMIPNCLQHFGCLMQLRGYNWGCLIEKIGVLFPWRSWRPLILLRWEKQLLNRFRCCAIGLPNCMLLAWKKPTMG